MADDRRLALEEAFDSAEADARGAEYIPPVRETTSPDTETAPDSNFNKLVPEGDEAGEQEQKAADARSKTDRPRTKGVPPDQRTGKPTTIATEKAAGDGETAPQPQSNLDKAPMGWGLNRDALWAKVPADARAAINKRESEIQRGMSDAGRVKAIANEYADVIKPFHQVFNQMGTNPREAITSVMKTATMLINGDQQTKANILTEFVMRYGVDLGTFDKSLSAALQAHKEGKPMPWLTPQQQQRQQPAPLDPRVVKLLERFEAAEQGQDERLRTEAATAIASIEGQPHFEDVRQEMADIMEIAAKRGVVLTVQQAYQKAVQLNPEVSKLVGQKSVAGDVSKAASTLARARRASSSVTGAPGGAAMSGKANTRRDALEAAWDSAG